MLLEEQGPISEADWAEHRKTQLQTLPVELLGLGDSLPDVLLPKQQELLAATALHNLVVSDKSRRVGFTWAIGADAVLSAGAARSSGGMDVLYIGYNLDMAREFIDCCAMWAKAFMPAVTEVGEFLFVDTDGHGDPRTIQAFRIGFASGFEIVALSSRPRSLRGRQGYVILDEFAFHDDAAGLLKAAMALLIWGGKVLVISTHNGVDNPFNELIQEIRAGKRPGAVVRCTFDEAIEQGLYQRVCLMTGREWSAEAEAKWRAEIYKSYGSDADEELRCIPSLSAGAYLSRAMIESCMHDDIPVIRWTAPPGFVDFAEAQRDAEIDGFFEERLKPLLVRLEPRLRSSLGQDFGRSGDLSVIHPMQLRQDLSRSTPFLLELRDMPFSSQSRLVFKIIDHLPRFSHAAFDATGNGANHAELVRQKFGVALVSEIKLSQDWYIQNMPKLKAAFEDRGIELPRDADILADYRAIQMTKGVAKVPDNVRTEGADGHDRHGDSAIAGALAWFASCQDSGIVRADPIGVERQAPRAFNGFAFEDQRADLSDFLRI